MKLLQLFSDNPDSYCRPFAICCILHNKNNASDIFTTGKLMKETNILMIRKAALRSKPWDSSTHRDGHE